MSDINKKALVVAAAALALGLLADGLLRAFPWGLNVGIWVAAALGAAALVLRGQQTQGDGRWLAAPILIFGFLLAWRDSSTLAALDVLVLMCLLPLASASARALRLRAAGVLQYLFTQITGWLTVAFSPFDLAFSGLPWRRLAGLRAGEGSRAGGAVLRGLLIAVPLLLVFGGLFAAADAVFAETVSHFFDFNLDSLFEHLFVIGLWGWIAAGLCWWIVAPRPIMDQAAARPSGLRLGLIEVATALGMLELLFAVFVAIQVRYLFGGETQLNLDSSLTYAEYARRGFFELVTVAALVLPLLLAAHWLLRPAEPKAVRVFGLAAGGLILLLAAVMASALQRMQLYQAEFGLTELRLYTTAFMGWLTLVFAALALTVLRNRPARFASVALALGLLMILLLHALNPDAFIAQTNAGRHDLRPFDGFYAASLSADVVPELIAALPLLSPAEQCQVAAQILREWPPEAAVDWRTWNWSRSEARRAIAADLPELRRMACPEGR